MPRALLMKCFDLQNWLAQGRGHYSMEVMGYEEVPAQIRDKMLEGL